MTGEGGPIGQANLNSRCAAALHGSSHDHLPAAHPAGVPPKSAWPVLAGRCGRELGRGDNDTGDSPVLFRLLQRRALLPSPPLLALTATNPEYPASRAPPGRADWPARRAAALRQAPTSAAIMPGARKRLHYSAPVPFGKAACRDR